MKVYVVGEDAVALAIGKRIVLHCINIENIEFVELPVRGSQIYSNINSYNELAKYYPVIIISDLDTHHCPIDLVNSVLPKANQSQYISFRIAITEGEAWLMADKTGFASHIKINKNQMPNTLQLAPQRRPKDRELNFNMKPSLYLMTRLAPLSTSQIIQTGLKPIDLTSKGGDYNLTLLPFIEQHWNINRAIINSYSLEKSVNKICDLLAVAQNAIT